MATRTAHKPDQAETPAPVKISIRVHPDFREDLKAVAYVSGMSLETWIETTLSRGMSRMRHALKELRAATGR